MCNGWNIVQGTYVIVKSWVSAVNLNSIVFQGKQHLDCRMFKVEILESFSNLIGGFGAGTPPKFGGPFQTLCNVVT